MTIAEMHLAVDLGLQRVASHVFDDFLPEEIDKYLNNAVLKYVEENRNALQDPEIAATQSEIVMENLRTIIKSASFSGGALQAHAVLPRTHTVDLTAIVAEYAYFLSARAQVDRGWKKCRHTSPLIFQDYATSVTDLPIFRELPLTSENGKFLVMRDSVDTTLTTLFVHYLRYPVKVMLDVDGGGAGNVDCDLPPHTHQRIVDLTVALMHSDLSKPQDERR